MTPFGTTHRLSMEPTSVIRLIRRVGSLHAVRILPTPDCKPSPPRRGHRSRLFASYPERRLLQIRLRQDEGITPVQLETAGKQGEAGQDQIDR
jgi:hypothetical protein